MEEVAYQDRDRQAGDHPDPDGQGSHGPAREHPLLGIDVVGAYQGLVDEEDLEGALPKELEVPAQNFGDGRPQQQGVEGHDAEAHPERGEYYPVHVGQGEQDAERRPEGP